MDRIATEGQSDCCRLCTARAHLLSVLQIKNGTNFQELISKHLNINIMQTDNLPTTVCGQCEEKLLAFHEFYESCIRVQDSFTKWILHETDSKSLLVKNEEDKCAMVAAPVNAIARRYEDNFKDEIKVELYSRSSSPNVNNFLEDSYPDSDHSNLLLSKLSNLKKKKTKGKMKIKKEKVKSEKLNSSRTKIDINIGDYINFSCSVCDMDCQSWYSLRSHSVQVHKVKPFVKCVLCNIIMRSKTVMYKHVAEHKESPTVFTCNICPKITKSAIAMENHKMRHVPKSERLFICEVCSKILKTNESLKYHRLCHLPIEERRIFPCDICHLKFTSKSAVVGHKRTVHDKIKRYVCDLCGYACATSHELRQHRAIHSEEKLFICNICSKPFKTDSNLKTHIDTHESTSYQCNVCNKVLNTRRTYRKHMLVHDTQRKHQCSFCKVSFKRRQTLKVHLNSHTGDKPIACKWCGERFMYSASYRMHKHRCHSEKIAQEIAALTATTVGAQHAAGLLQQLHIVAVNSATQKAEFTED